MTIRNVEQERQRLDDLQRRIDDAKRHLADIDTTQDQPAPGVLSVQIDAKQQVTRDERTDKTVRSGR